MVILMRWPWPSAMMTKVYDRTGTPITLDKVELIAYDN